MKDLGLDKSLIESRDTDSRSQRGWEKGFFGFRKMFRDYLEKLNVAYYDECCVTATPENIFPVRSNDGVLQFFDGDSWETLDLDAASIPDDLVVDTLDVDGIAISPAGGIVTSNMLVPFYPQVAPSDIAAGVGGAIDITSYFTTISTDAGGDAFTLADGTVVGQVKRIRLLVDGGGDAVITPANFTDTTITMDDAGDDVELMWDGVQWFTLVNIGATIA